MLTLSLRDRDRLAVLHQVRDGLLRPSSGARKLGLSARQFRRLRRRFEREGDCAVIHRARGRRSNHHLEDSLHELALERAQEPVFHDFGPTLLAEHLSRDPRIGQVHPATLRRWLIAAGHWSVEPRKLKHRERRARKSACGELVQMDTSVHPWLEGRSREPLVLIALIDDATSRLFARFAESDSGSANRRVLLQYLERYGRMRALYTDHAPHFHPTWSVHRRREEELPPLTSQIGHALRQLDIALLLARSPQAKGRIERVFGTLQDRLVKELRVAGINSLESANAYLESVFLPFWNAHFTEVPADPNDAHRPLPPELDLYEVLAHVERRRIQNDFTIRFRNTHYQIAKKEADPLMPGSELEVLKRLDSRVSFRWRDRTLALTPALRPDAPRKPKPAAVVRPVRPAPATHPWRRDNMRFSVHH